jgi:hypothetical protein
MSEEFFNIEFDHDNIHYNGIITPSEKIREDGTPKSFHVVLNKVLFGNVHYNNSKWAVDEQRPDALTEIVGKQIEQYYQPRGIVM